MAAIMPSSASPLLLLLDGILSQDNETTQAAMEQIGQLDPKLTAYMSYHNMGSPIRSSAALEVVVDALMGRMPHLARVASDSDGSLPLHFAASIGNVRVASLLLTSYREAAVRHNAKGKIPLHYAAREGRVEMVRFLLSIAPECASVATKKTKLAIHFAAGEGHVDVVRALLQAYPDGAIIPSKKGKVALHFAARWGQMMIARDLLDVKPDSVRILDSDGSTPLHDACREGQLEMAKLLVERYPPAMTVSNIRGEIPLLSAIRSGAGSGSDVVVDLCTFLVRSWPTSGSIVIQRARKCDNVKDWDPAVLELTLRGAANNFTYGIETSVAAAALSIPAPRMYQLDDNSNRSHPCQDGFGSNGSLLPNTKQVTVHHSSLQGTSESTVPGCRSSSCSTSSRSSQSLEINLPRSKSPILAEENLNGKRRSGAGGTNDNKRPRKGSVDGASSQSFPCTKCHQSHDESETCKIPFQKLHTALKDSASSCVLDCILDRCEVDEIKQVDDLGRLPLHLAAQRCGHPEPHGAASAAFSPTTCAEEKEDRTKLIDLIKDKIWERYPDASTKRDYLGRLPIHLALAARSDCRVVKLLLDANPSSGIEHCDTVDLTFTEKLPIHVAADHDCDLSTMYQLLRVDPSVVQTWE
mmetsp:Transcript_37879/g.92191  ORF Transcript_37879/g.92191 Transcript_37879/m.92191 type:complete len:639 (-) Transcript_37879:782-2698(-)